MADERVLPISRAIEASPEPGSTVATDSRDSKLRIGVIGAGKMGEAHLAAYALMPGVRIVGLASRTASRAAELAHRFGIEATFNTPEQLIESVRPDGVSITTGEHDHLEPTLYALKHHVGVLVEKPIATRAIDAVQMADTARASGAILLPGHILRFTPPYQRLRAEVSGGRVGPVVGIASRRDRSRAIARHYSRVHPAFLSAVHDIDLTLWLTGSHVTRVRALEHREAGQPQPCLVWAQLELKSGALATISTASLHPEEGPIAYSDRIEVYGVEGVAVVDLSVPVLAIHASPSALPDWLFEARGFGPFDAEIAHFCACLRAGRSSNVVSVDDAVEGIRVADAIVHSAAEGGRDIWL